MSIGATGTGQGINAQQASLAAGQQAVAQGVQPRAVDIGRVQAALLGQGAYLRPASQGAHASEVMQVAAASAGR